MLLSSVGITKKKKRKNERKKVASRSSCSLLPTAALAHIELIRFPMVQGFGMTPAKRQSWQKDALGFILSSALIEMVHVATLFLIPCAVSCMPPQIHTRHLKGVGGI
ncbi:hypothetical protein LY76DRAFT_116603 [Colletotrichum caudatum]|nr:hypothetical protein LY76DRAFT_116603 [Colletotrichum caudatum]